MTKQVYYTIIFIFHFKIITYKNESVTQVCKKWGHDCCWAAEEKQIAA